MSVYRVTELIGTSTESWEKAAATAVQTASQTLRDLRVAEVVKQDVQINEGGEVTYRIKLQVSFKYEAADGADRSPGNPHPGLGASTPDPPAPGWRGLVRCVRGGFGIELGESSGDAGVCQTRSR